MTTPAEPLVVRPRRIVIYAVIAAVVVVGTSVVTGVLLQESSDGVRFRVADQVGMIGIGVVLGVVILGPVARPKLVADAQGLRIRNMIGHRNYPWELVHGISFPEGAHWPTLLLPDDETYAVMAIQAMDRRRAVTALRALRALFDAYAPPPPEPSAEAKATRQAEMLRQLQDRPLGRLELMDLQRGNGRRRGR